MSSKPYGLQFSEAMAGYLGPGDDYRAGYRAGRSMGNSVRLTVTIVIEDMERFLDDPEHQGALAGSLDYTVLGSDLMVDDGRLLLFSRRNGEKRILYYLPFDRDDEHYLLFGQKIIGADPGFRALRDLTTLYTDLLRRRESGEPVGSPLARGVLITSPRQAMRELLTFRSMGQADLLSMLLLNTRFVSSFSWELADTYGRRLISAFQPSKARRRTEKE